MLARRTLLLADDSLTIQKVVSLTFADEGMRVLTAGGGGEALAQLEQTVPDLVLADVHMPAPGGYELCARIKRDARLKHVPVILLVGAFEPFDEAEARKSGADGFLTKPFQSIRELVNRVGGMLGGQPDTKKTDAGEEAGRRAGWPADAAPVAETRAVEVDARPDDAPAAPAFAGFDEDDETIRRVPADDYVALGRERAARKAAEFSSAEGSFALRGEGAGEEVFAFGGASRPAAREARGAATAAPVAVKSAPKFEALSPQPPAEDSLLDLGVFDSPASRATDSDDLILDIDGDYEEAASAMPASSGFDEVLQAGSIAGSIETEPRGESQTAGEISPANLSNAWSDKPQFEVSPPAAAEPAPSSFVRVEDSESRAVESVGEVSEAEVETVESDAPETFAAAPELEAASSVSAEAAAGETHSIVAGTVSSPEATTHLSPEMIDTIARRVVELLSDRTVRDIAWEVVPELAERLIRQRLESEKTQAR